MTWRSHSHFGCIRLLEIFLARSLYQDSSRNFLHTRRFCFLTFNTHLLSHLIDQLAVSHDPLFVKRQSQIILPSVSARGIVTSRHEWTVEIGCAPMNLIWIFILSYGNHRLAGGEGNVLVRFVSLRNRFFVVLTFSRH